MRLLQRRKSFSRVKPEKLSIADGHRRRDDAAMTNLSKPIPSKFRDPEPALADLLNDSVLQWLLISDRIDRSELDAVIRCAQWRLGPRRASEMPVAGCCA
jgi:hypothetical protein